MKIIPNINITTSEYGEIRKQVKATGSEGVICIGLSPNTLYKLFTVDANFVPMPENKQRKIAKLYGMDLEHCIKPLSTISMNGEIIGYEMTYDPEATIYKPEQFSRTEKIHFLRQTKEILEGFARKDIIYGDVAGRNILINRRTGEIKFCDIDNIQIGNLPMDLIPSKLEMYEMIRGIDDKTDSYMHNAMTLNSFHIYDSSRMKSDFKRKAKRIVKTMRYPERYKGEYIIDYVKTRGFKK